MFTIYRATLDTRHFAFEAFGMTEEAARAAMKETLGAHAWQYRLEPGWYEPGEIACLPLIVGRGYRNGELVTATAKPD